jgi:type I restriction-modification system DNA methylase subunit
MSIEQYDNDFATYVANEDTRKKLGMVFTPYSIIEQMMDKAGLVSDKNSIWYDETKTNLDPTMGTGNIVIGMLYRRIVECGQNPKTALSNVYGVELDKDTLDYAKNRIKKFMSQFTKEDLTDIIDHNFVCSDIFQWDIENWKPMSQSTGNFEDWLE